MLINLVIVAFAVAGMSCTTSKAKVMKPVRDWIMKRSKTLGYLIQCPYCMSHWFAAGLTSWMVPLAGFDSLVGWLVEVFAIVALAAIITGLIDRAFFWTETEVEFLREENQALRSELEDIAHGTEAS